LKKEVSRLNGHLGLEFSFHVIMKKVEVM